MQRTIQRALISVFHKEGLAPIVEKLHAHGVEILSTGGTQKAIEALGAKVTLRGDRMWFFLDRLFSVAIPRIRDFRGLNPKSFDQPREGDNVSSHLHIISFTWFALAPFPTGLTRRTGRMIQAGDRPDTQRAQRNGDDCGLSSAT